MDDLTRGQKLDNVARPEKGSEPARRRRAAAGFAFFDGEPARVTRVATKVLTASEIERALDELRNMIHFLSPPLNQRPGLFLEQKDALDQFVLGLQRRMGFQSTSPTSFRSPQRDSGIAAICSKGRIIPIQRRRMLADKQT
jgi:hypothetical protein